MGIFMKTSLNKNISLHTVLGITPIIYNINGLREFLNLCLLLLMYITGCIDYSRFDHCRSICKKRFLTVIKMIKIPVAVKYTIWVATLNLVLIVICNPTIVNPGPVQSKNPKNNISVLYQNIRGLIPPSHLGNPNPPLCSIKLSEFQTYIFDKKTDIVILNETWLSKNLNDSEIFPNDSYKIFRMDRTRFTHPIDPSDPDKYKKYGGGVLIAVKSELQCESKEINIKCKAEIISIEIGLRDGRYICLSTFYRVGDLGAENHRAVDSYLRDILKRKKCNKFVLIGDLNLNKVS